jgi:uncharacterized protein YjdB
MKGLAPSKGEAMKRIGLVALFSLLAIGCGNNSVPPVNQARDLEIQQDGRHHVFLKALQVTPARASVPVGFPVALTATAVYSDGRHEDVTETATWTSFDPAVATVVAGLVQGRATGHVKIRATFDGHHDASKIRVTDAKLAAIEVVADASDVPWGTTVRARATGFFSDGAFLDVTSVAAWSTEAGRLVFEAPGLARAVAVGPDRLVASIGGVSGGASVTVTAGPVVGVQLRLLEASIPEGATTQVAMEATFADGSVSDVSGETVFGSEDLTIVTVVGPGRVKGVDEGLTNVTGLYQGLLATAPLLVTEAEPQVLLVQPPTLQLALGAEANLLAVGHYTNECDRDDTEDVEWISSDPAVVSVSNVCGCHGEVMAVGPGQATVTATHVEQGLAAVIVVTVGPPALSRIVILPRVPVLTAGTTLQLTAQGTLTDGSTADVTSQMSWMSWSPSLMSVDRGLVTGLSPGKGTIMAQDPTREEIVFYITVTVY